MYMYIHRDRERERERVGMASSRMHSWDTRATTTWSPQRDEATIISEFRDVVFEDVVFDNHINYIILQL